MSSALASGVLKHFFWPALLQIMQASDRSLSASPAYEYIAVQLLSSCACNTCNMWTSIIASIRYVHDRTSARRTSQEVLVHEKAITHLTACQDVCPFDVPMHHALLVQICQSMQHLHSIQISGFLLPSRVAPSKLASSEAN